MWKAEACKHLTSCSAQSVQAHIIMFCNAKLSSAISVTVFEVIYHGESEQQNPFLSEEEKGSNLIVKND